MQLQRHQFGGKQNLSGGFWPNSQFQINISPTERVEIQNAFLEFENWDFSHNGKVMSNFFFSIQNKQIGIEGNWNLVGHMKLCFHIFERKVRKTFLSFRQRKEKELKFNARNSREC